MSQEHAYSASFLRSWLRMIREPQFHDVTFIVGKGKDQEIIGANKALLAIHCPVFEAMFNSTMLESNANSEIPLPDVDPIVFRTMLHWMVSDQLRVHSITYLQPLIRLADYYQIKPLVKTSCSFLKSNTITIYVIVDQALSNHHGTDLGLANHNLRNLSLRVRILSNSTVSDARAAIAQHLGVSKENLQLWRVSHRKNGTVRPNRYLEDDSISLSSKAEASDHFNTYYSGREQNTDDTEVEIMEDIVDEHNDAEQEEEEEEDQEEEEEDDEEPEEDDEDDELPVLEAEIQDQGVTEVVLQPHEEEQGWLDEELQESGAQDQANIQAVELHDENSNHNNNNDQDHQGDNDNIVGGIGIGNSLEAMPPVEESSHVVEIAPESDHSDDAPPYAEVIGASNVHDNNNASGNASVSLEEILLAVNQARDNNNESLKKKHNARRSGSIGGWDRFDNKPHFADDSSGDSLWEEEADQYILYGVKYSRFSVGNSKGIKTRGIHTTNNSSGNNHSGNTDNHNSNNSGHMTDAMNRCQKQKKRSSASYVSSITGMYQHKRRKLNASERKRPEWKHYTGPNPTKGMYARIVGYGCGLQDSSTKSEKFNEFGGVVGIRMNDGISKHSKDKNKDRDRDKERNDPKPLDIDEKLPLDIDEGIGAKSERLDDESEIAEKKRKNNHRNNNNNLNYSSIEESIRIPRCVYTRKKDDNSILLFLKYFDVYHQSLSIVGSVIISKDATIIELVQLIRKIAGWSSEREVLLWEEEDCDGGKIQSLEEHKQINDCQLVDGDIIVFQEKSTLLPLMHLPDAKSFLKSLAKPKSSK